MGVLTSGREDGGGCQGSVSRSREMEMERLQRLIANLDGSVINAASVCDVAKIYLSRTFGSVLGLAEELHEEFYTLTIDDADAVATELVSFLQRGGHVSCVGPWIIPAASAWMHSPPGTPLSAADESTSWGEHYEDGRHVLN